MVSLVLVAHSERLLGALVELVEASTRGGARCHTAGGTEDGRMGTSVDRVRRALGTALAGDAGDCLVLYDTGSAWLTVEFALDELPPASRARIVVSHAPLVEGTLAAAARAAEGAAVDEVAAAAASALDTEKQPSPAPAGAAPARIGA